MKLVDIKIKTLLILALFQVTFDVSTVYSSKFEMDASIDFHEQYVERDYIGNEKYVEIDNIKVCYIDEGLKNADVLLFIHGLSLSIHNFRYNYPYFFDKYRVVAIDLPGFGKSDFPDISYDIDYFSRFLLKFMDKLNIRSATLIGNSLGAHIALDFDLKYPDRVDALVIGSATGVRPTLGLLEKIVLNWYITEDRFCDVPEKKMREHIEWSWYRLSPRSEELVRHRILYRRKYFGTRLYKDNNRAFVRGLKHVIYDDIRYKVKDINTPALIIWGRYDKVTKPADALYLSRKIPDSELKIIDDAGHLAHIEQFEAYNSAVEKFLERKLPYIKLTKKNHKIPETY